MIRSMKILWRGWKRLAHGIITAQNTILLGIAFVFGIGPTAIVLKLMGRSMIDREPVGEDTADSFWIPLESTKADMQKALKPF